MGALKDPTGNGNQWLPDKLITARLSTKFQQLTTEYMPVQNFFLLYSISLMVICNRGTLFSL